MKGKQISFFEIEDKPKEKPRQYDATICGECLCDKCLYNVNIHPYPSEEEIEVLKQEESCFNCDDCFYYGMDQEELEDLVKFKCKRFKKLGHYVELEANRRRKAFKII